MSASIDKGQTGSEGNSRELLSAWLDDYIAGRCDHSQMHESFLEVCRSNPEAPWDALALLDQYQRRGRVDVALARSLKTEIAQLVFGVANQTEAPQESEATLDNTGSRWRKLYEERGSLNADAAPIEDPVTRAFDPVTRPPPTGSPAARTQSSPASPPAARPTPATSPTPQAAESDVRVQRDASHQAQTPGRESAPARRRFEEDAAPRFAADPPPSPFEAVRPAARPAARQDATKVSGRSETARAPGASEAPKAPSKAEVGVGTVLRERYELIHLIEAGDSYSLYRAFDRHRSHLPPPRCYVAVRLFDLPPHGREAALVELERQAYAAQSLAHPNIACVFDLDRHEDVYFVVMELIDGEPLSDVMRRLAGKPMSRERALAVIGAVGAALLHAHQRHIVHGDLKPAAIALTTTGDIKVLDFGFARTHALDHWSEGEPSVDGADASTTCAYASAERVAGEPPHVRDDVYSLACIAYELLGGRHPYGGRSAALARAHGRRAKKLSGLSLRQWNALQSALHWNRDERRISLADFLSVLGCAEAAPQSIHTPHARESFDNPFGRGKGMLLALLLIVAAGVTAWWQLPRFIDPGLINPIAGPIDSDPERALPSSVLPPMPQTETANETETEMVEPATIAEVESADTSAPPPVEAPSGEAAAIKPPSAAIVAATADPLPTEDSAQSAGNAAPRAEESGSASQASASARAPTTSVEFDKDTYVVTEGDGMVQVTVRRNGGTRGAVKFRWVLRSNSAEAGSDYADLGPGIEEIPHGTRTATITVPLVQDSIAENTEMFFVEIEALEDGPPIGEQAHAAVIIVDDD